MKVGDVQFEGRAVLAPMAGITDSAFRRICRGFGAAATFSGMVSTEGLVRGNRRTLDYLTFQPEERPIGIQIFGGNPGVMANAARIVEKYGPDFIDLNFGCPARKVVKKGAGAALLKDLKTLEGIARSVVKAVGIPVTAKIRTGWGGNGRVVEEAARRLEDAGCTAITVHARTAKQDFRQPADWSVIGRVKSVVGIPVIGNGDVRSASDAGLMLEQTGCDGVMVGRGALGNPWIFAEINAALRQTEWLTEPSFPERIEVCLAHFDTVVEEKGDYGGVREMRKYIGWYLKGMPGSAKVRAGICRIADPQIVRFLLRNYKQSLEKGQSLKGEYVLGMVAAE